MKIRVAGASAKLRQSNRTDKRVELTMQSLHSYWTAHSYEEQRTWRKLLLTWSDCFSHFRWRPHKHRRVFV